MSQKRRNAEPGTSTAATVGYEAQLWRMADALRGAMDAAEYKHVVLGLIFLKYISDAFEEQHARLEAERAQGADPEDPDEYRAVNVFWVPPEARWAHLKHQARQPTIGQLVDDAMAGIERENGVSAQAHVSEANVKPRSGGRSHNPALKGVLPKDYARPALDKQRLGQLIDLVSNISFASPSPASAGEGRCEGANAYHDIPGFYRSATLEKIRKHGHVLTPGRYVGAEVKDDDDEPFEAKLQRLVAQLREQQAEAAKLDAAIERNLQEPGFWEAKA